VASMDENTIALVTGAGAGIGRACARALAAAGALAIATDINGAAAAQTVDLILDDAGRPEDIAAAVVFLSSAGKRIYQRASARRVRVAERAHGGLDGTGRALVARGRRELTEG